MGARMTLHFNLKKKKRRKKIVKNSLKLPIQPAELSY
jgi:hypothetical protein